MECPGEEQLIAYLDGALAGDEKAAIDAHLGACPGCAQLFAAAIEDAFKGTAGALPDSALESGGRVGRYLVLAPIGAGAMGVVYAAYDPELGRQVALKLLRPVKDERGEASARLLREAQAMARLTHPNVVAVYDAGTFEAQVFIAMELIAGGTLASWRTAQGRTWREVLRVFLLAGRGLAAAHKAGLVHRDFKPDNVLLGDDGRVLVTDFGLARIAEQPQETGPAGAVALPPATPRTALASPLTRTGTLIGSPAYMAPEQLRGEPPGVRSDIFSFCVALHECLCGERPFAGGTLGELQSAIERGELREPPPGRAVPVFLRRVLARGLRGNPVDRYPSMEALLHDLEEAPKLRTRRRVTAAALLLLGVAAALAVRGTLRARAQLCSGAPAQLASTWNAEVGAQLTRTLAAKGPAVAQPMAGFNAALDSYTAEWARMRTEACEATRLRGEQSEALLDLRMGCLDRRLQDVSALVSAVGSVSAGSVKAAAQAVEKLAPLSLCANAQALQAVGPTPADPARHGQVQALQKQVSELRASRLLGSKEAIARGRELAAAAGALGFQPLTGQVLYELGVALDIAADPTARRTLLQASATALAAHDDATAASSFTRLLQLEGYDGHFAEARGWDALADACVQRLGGDDALEGARLAALATVIQDEGKYSEASALRRKLLERARRREGAVEGAGTALALQQLAVSLRREGRLDEANDEARRSLAIYQRLYGERDASTADVHNVLGIIESIRGHLPVGEAELRQALAGYEVSLGADHPNTADALNNLAGNLAMQGRAAEAVPVARRVLDIYRRSLGEDHLRTAGGYLAVGRLAREAGDPAAAVPLLERAVAITAAKDPSPIPLADARLSLAQAIWASGVDRQRARALAREARAAFAAFAASYPQKANQEELANAERVVASMNKP